MAHAQRNPCNPSDEESPTPRGRDSVSQQQTPHEEPAPAPNPPDEPGDEGNPPPGGPGGPLPNPPPPNPPAPPPAPAPAIDDPPELPNKKKSHVKKPEDFEDAKQWDKYKQQTFVYIQENKKDFSGDESIVRFLLSFMTGGLPEKFAANFIDEVVADYEEEKRDHRIYGGPRPVADWGTADEFYEKCEEAFGDQNKKANAEHQLALLRQGSKTAEEYLQEFDQLARTAGYQRNHDDVLIKYLNEQVKSSIIDKIYALGRLPTCYKEWKEAILNIDGLERRRAEQKKFVSAQHSNPTPRTNPPPRTPTERKTTPAPQTADRAPKVELDVARAKCLCFRCGKPGHMSRNCPDKGKFQVCSLVTELTDEEKKEGMETLRKEGF
jgi:Retrotransposon gag protein/Zinc knuckle